MGHQTFAQRDNEFWRATVLGNKPAGFGKGPLGAPAKPSGVALESSTWRVVLGLRGMRLETAFPGV